MVISEVRDGSTDLHERVQYMDDKQIINEMFTAIEEKDVESVTAVIDSDANILNMIVKLLIESGINTKIKYVTSRRKCG